MTPTRLSLNCNFAAASFLDPLFTFTRPSNATRINPQTGLIETVAANVPRLEKDGLLIEGAATNFLPHTTWNGPGNVPDGLDYAKNNNVAVSDEIPTLLSLGLPARHQHSGSGDNNVGSLIASTPAGPAVFSIWLWLRSDQADAQYAGILPSIEGGGTYDFRWLTAPDLARRDCWQRIAVAFISAGDPFLFVLRTSGTGIFYTQCWQLESSAAPTSYIPTTGVPATRAGDYCATAVQAPWFNSAEGTLVCDASSFEIEGNRAFEIGYVDWENALIYQFVTWGCEFVSTRNQVQQASVFIGPHGRNKLALSWSGGRLKKSAANGAFLQTLDAAMPSIDKIALGSNIGGPWSNLNGHIRALQILPHAVSDGVLQAMSAQ